MIENTILKKNRRGLKALVLGMTFPSTELIELVARAGFDAINLDGEHGAFTPESVNLICRVANAYGMSVTARVPSFEPPTINLWLDRGIQGVTAPHVDTGEQAQQLADACLFPPAGRRSWGGGRGTQFSEAAHINPLHRGEAEYMQWANANMIVACQIESKRAYDNLDAILAVKGISAITGGPRDFAASMGYPGQPDHPERQRLTADAEARARQAGKWVMSDLEVGSGVQELILAWAREFVRTRAETPIGPD